MTDSSHSQDHNSPSGEALSLDSERWARIFTKAQEATQAFMRESAGNGAMSEAWVGVLGEMAKAMAANPQALMDQQWRWAQEQYALWQRTMGHMLGQEPPPDGDTHQDDKDARFKDEAWQDSPLFSYVRQSYLLTSQCIQGLTETYSQELETPTQDKVNFYTRQLTDALSPTNFAHLNPAVLRETARSGGENLIQGFENILDDLKAGDGCLRISMTDPEAFKVGESLAMTPGKVIFRNRMMELIHYTPTQKKVYQRPLLIVPPWINKFYILDLREKNSMVCWLCAQGVDVFMISWVNPDASYRDTAFEAYMHEGVLEACGVVQKATGQEDLNAAGYCLGGTLLAATLAWSAAAGEVSPIKCATYFATMVDFSEPGDLGVFVDEEQVSALEAAMEERGYLKGSEMATTFNMMRANDLIWYFVINNYLMGKTPFPFDLLYWNADSTRMPARMHSFYLRKMYLENALIQPGGLTLAGRSLDVGAIKVPSFVLATREDHIAPWRSTYAAVKAYGGENTFVLAESGHIAGVISHPEHGKYGHWSHDGLPGTPEAWFEGAVYHEGSWWPRWLAWLKPHMGLKISADRGLPAPEALCDAPGTYVLVRDEV